MLRLVRRRAALQEQLREAEDAMAYSRILVRIAYLNRQLTILGDQPARRSLGFLKPLDESPDEQTDPGGNLMAATPESLTAATADSLAPLDR